MAVKKDKRSQAIVSLRMALGMTQQDLADALDLSPALIARWETNKPPKMDNLLRLSDFAFERGEENIAQVFSQLVLDEVLPHVHLANREGSVKTENDGSGYAVVRFGNTEDLKECLRSLSVMVEAGVIGKKGKVNHAKG